MLLSARSDAVLENGETALERERERLAEQRRQVDTQIEAVRAGEAERAVARQRVVLDRIETAQDQIALQVERMTQAKTERDRVADLRTRDLTTASQLADREAALGAARSDLLRAERDRDDLVADREAAAATRERLSVLMGQMAELDGTETVAARDSAFVLRAPVAGTVTNLIARLGQPVGPDVPAMLILPEGARLQADLAIPASAIGFVEAGQPVRLSIDTFPVERFGAVAGEVATISRTSVVAEGDVRLWPYRTRVEALSGLLDPFRRK